jgi:hypothetical protein
MSAYLQTRIQVCMRAHQEIGSLLETNIFDILPKDIGL